MTDNDLAGAQIAYLEGEAVARGHLFDRAIREIEDIIHPCHDACVGDLHADCQCAAWFRQEAVAALERLAMAVAS